MNPHPRAEARPNPRHAAILGAVLLAVGVIVLWHLAGLVTQGGGRFAQGDWLINFASGVVRRGAGGEALLWLSDTTGLGPLALVGAIQAGLIMLTLSAIFRAALVSGLPDRLLLLLVSPLFVAFWAIDPDGAFRKELLGYIAFLPLLARGPTAAGPLIAGLTVPLFLVAVTAHEGNVFLMPALIVALWLRLREQVSRRLLTAITVALVAVTLGGLLFAVAYPFVPDNAAMCAALTARGVSPDICGGAIDWMGITPQETRHRLQSLAAGRDRMAGLLTFVVLLLPVGLAYRHAPNPGRTAAVGALLFAGFMPLYLLAADWGRWMSMFVFGMTFITLILARNPQCGWLHRPVRPMVFVPILLMSGFLGVAHDSGAPIRGLLPTLAENVLAKGLGGHTP
ncbi:MAG: hypothetical protein KDK01_03665 [Rhodobacteraceae bacterium]|nr:hypothetical protein [Paracoccaceae bacterium]